MRRRSMLVALVALQLTHAVAWGQAASDEPSALDPRPASADVNAAVKRGIELRREGKDEEALEVFRDALAHAPTSNRIRVQLATALQALGRWQEAQRYLREAIQHREDPYIARHYAELSQALDYVSDRLGTIEIRGTPPGADVFLSGRHIGALPLEPQVVPTGSYVLEVRLDGYYPAVRALTVSARGFHRERLELLPLAVAAAPSPLPARAAAPSHDTRASTPSNRWVWALAGTGAASGVAAIVALILRERYASRWNSDDCLAGQRTRGDNCASDLDHGRTAGQVAIVSATAAGALLGSAATVAWLTAESDDGAARAPSGCFAWAGGMSCATSF